MNYNNYKNKIRLLLAACLTFLLSGCFNRESKTNTFPIVNELRENPDTLGSEQIAVEPPPFSEGIYPCNDCHSEITPNPVRRELVDMHDSISAIFNHDKQNRWCLDCHDQNNRNYLRLASGKLLDFKESYKLCGQCHGEKLRDWKVGVHGKRTGYWNGKKEYLLCVACHSPHSPRFKPLKPEPPPIRQEDI